MVVTEFLLRPHDYDIYEQENGSMTSFRKLVVAFILFVTAVLVGSKVLPRMPVISIVQTSPVKQTVVYEDSVITEVVKKSLPSVVTVSVSLPNDLPGGTGPSSYPPSSQNDPGGIQGNIGSGFIVSASGYVITNKHVVDITSVPYEVVTSDNKTYKVQKIYRDPLNDLAILKIDTPAGNPGLTPIPLGDSQALELGQTVVAIGTPLGQLQNTVTHGIISGLGRGILAGSPFEGSVERLDNVIQTDAAINPGNSGGPLLNSSGQVIGISTAIAEGGQNIGFAIPVNSVKDLLTLFQKNGSSFERPYIGIRYVMSARVPSTGTAMPLGAYVAQVIPGSPADKAGIVAGDIIAQFDGQKIDGSDDQQLTKLLLQKKIGESVNVTLIRSGQTFAKTIVLGAAS